jgi:hypothetical protein
MAGESERLERDQFRWPANIHDGQRLLALDLRNRRTGFVVLERPTKLLDWGVRTFTHKRLRPGVLTVDRIAYLLDYYSPKVVVVRRSKSSRRMMQRVRSETRSRTIDLRIFSARPVQQFFSERGCKNKYETALHLVGLFEDLRWKVPPRRKPWQSENHNTTIFDAAAVALMFLLAEQ